MIKCTNVKVFNTYMRNLFHWHVGLQRVLKLVDVLWHLSGLDVSIQNIKIIVLECRGMIHITYLHLAEVLLIVKQCM